MSAAQAVSMLRLAYRSEFPDDRALFYGMALGDLDDREVTAAVERLVRGSKFLPSIAEIREEVAEAHLGLPNAAEAWDIVLTGNLRNAPVEVQAASRSCGGRETIMHSDNPTTIRAQFIRDYQERRRDAVRAFTGARIPPALPGPAMLGTTMAELPETTRIRPRPIMARLHHYWASHDLEPPTEEEKVDAIDILRQGPSTDDPMMDPLYAMAERVFHEASA